MDQAEDQFVDGFCMGLLNISDQEGLPAHYCYALAGFLCMYHAAVKVGEWARIALLQSVAAMARTLTDTHQRRN